MQPLEFVPYVLPGMPPAASPHLGHQVDTIQVVQPTGRMMSEIQDIRTAVASIEH